MIDHDARRLLMRVFVLLLMFGAIETKGQTLPATKNLGLGNIGGVSNGVHSIGYNPAGIASIERPVLSALYSEYFFSTNTQSLTGKIAYPAGFLNFGTYVHYYRFKDFYQTLSTGLTLAKSLSKDFAVGLSTNYHLINLATDLQRNHFSFDVGAQYALSQLASIGLSASHLRLTTTANNPSFQPIHLRLGSSYIFTQQVVLLTEISYSEQVDFAFGTEYLPMSWLAVRGGISVNPFMQYVGAGVITKKFNFDIATSHHPQLGYSPQISIDYRF